MKLLISIVTSILIAGLNVISAQNHFVEVYQDSATQGSKFGIVLGHTQDQGFLIGGIQLTQDKTNFYFLKVDSNGNILNKQSYPNAGHLEGVSFDLTKSYNRNFLMTGLYNADSTTPLQGILMKLNGIGDTLWTKRLKHTHDAGYTSIARSKFDSTYVMTGFKKDSNNLFNAYVRKISANGKKIWDLELPIDSHNVLFDITPTKDSNYLATGMRQKNDFGVQKDGLDLLIAKIGADGTLIWKKSWDSLGTERAHKIIPAHDDGYVIYGTKADTGFFGFGAQSHNLFVKIDKNGKQLYYDTFSITTDDSDQNIIPIQPNHYITSSLSEFTMKGVEGSFLAPELHKLNEKGQVIWQKPRAIQNKNFIPFDLIQVKKNKFALTGSIREAAYNYAVLIVFDSLGNVSSVAPLDENRQLKIDLYPNPVHSTLNLKIPVDKKHNFPYKFVIMNSAGQKLRSIPIRSTIQKLNVNALKAGNYIYLLTNEQKVLDSGVIVKQ